MNKALKFTMTPIMQIFIIGVDMPIIYIYIYIYIYNYIYIYTHIFPVTYFGIYGNKRNPGDEKMADQKKKCSLIALKQCCLFFRGLKRKKKDYTLASGLKTHLRIDLNSLGKVCLFKENAWIWKQNVCYIRAQGCS